MQTIIRVYTHCCVAALWDACGDIADIDICKQWGACSQNCTHSPAGKMCSCYPGYELTSDKWTCKALGRSS